MNGSQAAAFPQTTIRPEEPRVAAHELIEVGTRDLFLALDDPTDGHRRFAVEGGLRLHQPGVEVASRTEDGHHQRKHFR